jgi:hypothetical protein
MTNICKSRFYFGCENAQKGSSVIDIGVYFGSILIFTIEAKLLPIPEREEFEYVYGKGGEIQRFKDGKHGVDNSNNFLPENGMISYIKEKDFDYWFDKINQWIVEAGWHESEKLTQKYPNQNDKYESKHHRIDNSFLKLHHFWVSVTN